MPEEFENPQNLNEESFKDEAENLKYLEKESRETEGFLKDLERIEKSKDTAHSLFIIAFKILFWIGIGLLVIWIWHLVWPVSWHWLGESRLDVIENILIAAGSCGIVVKYVQKQLPD